MTWLLQKVAETGFQVTITLSARFYPQQKTASFPFSYCFSSIVSPSERYTVTVLDSGNSEPK